MSDNNVTKLNFLQMNKEKLEQHKAQLEQWWGEQADSFPGEFSTWLLNRIKDKMEESDLDHLFEDIMVYAYEIEKPLEIEKLSFRGDNLKFVEMIAQKHSVSTQGLHRLAKTDTSQTIQWVNKQIEDKRKEGHDIRLFASKKLGPVFAAYTNDNFDVFGFCKVIHNGSPKMQTFVQRNVRLF